jgi:hypothetical protein
MKGITQKDLYGNNQSAISTIENNPVEKVLKDKTIFSISQKLDIDPDILFYAAALIPPHIRQEIASNPLYYMEGIKELSNKSEAEKNKMKKQAIIAKYIFNEEG